jgi:hypothetical protein
MFLPANVFILVVYWMIYLEFRRTASRVAAHGAASSESTPPRRHAEFVLALQLFLIFIFFNVSLAPPILAVTVFDRRGTKLSTEVYILLETLCILNSVANPFMYLIFHKRFRCSLCTFLRTGKFNSPEVSVQGTSRST